jgi:tryptophanyl-tRNA synthetase
MYVPGTDGVKMSKSKGNIINLFLPDKQLRKQVMKIATDSTPLEEPKNPDTCNLFALYKLVANERQIEKMRANYVNGGYGYGHAKQAFFELLIEKFKEERAKYNYYMENISEIDKALLIGSNKAENTAREVLNRVRCKLGFL